MVKVLLTVLAITAATAAPASAETLVIRVRAAAGSDGHGAACSVSTARTDDAVTAEKRLADGDADALAAGGNVLVQSAGFEETLRLVTHRQYFNEDESGDPLQVVVMLDYGDLRIITERMIVRALIGVAGADNVHIKFVR